MGYSPRGGKESNTIEHTCVQLWRVRTSDQGEAGGLTCVGPRDEPEAAVLQRGVFQGNPQAQHPTQGLRVQEGGVLVRGDCSRPAWA